MASTLWALYGYARAVVTTFIARFQPDYVLVQAELYRNGMDPQNITTEAIAALAVEDESFFKHPREDGGIIVCTYNLKGDGPYKYVIDEKNPTFPPSPPSRDMIPIGERIILVEKISKARDEEEEEEEEDVTEEFIPFIGPDGTYHGRGEPNLQVIFPNSKDGDEIVITMGSGETSTMQITQEEMV